MFVNLRAALWAETLKARRARMPRLTLAGFALVPLMGALFMKILLDPTWAARFGALTTKAQFSAAHGDWPTYFGLLTQALAVGGSIIFSLVVIWLFGREYSDHTAKDLLALPTPRAAIVTAKLLPGRDLVCCPDPLDLPARPRPRRADRSARLDDRWMAPRDGGVRATASLDHRAHAATCLGGERRSWLPPGDWRDDPTGLSRRRCSPCWDSAPGFPGRLQPCSVARLALRRRTSAWEPICWSPRQSGGIAGVIAWWRAADQV